jgi:hypothetical protein
MKRKMRKKLYHQFCCIVLLLPIFVFSSCGRPEHGASDALSVSLDQPSGDEDLFWYGVSARTLKIVRDGETKQEIPWNSGQALEFDLKEGDSLVFSATDEQGRLVISGTATVGKEKKVSIPIRRIL